MTHKFHAICNVKNAILGPTPGREQSSSTVFGRSESKSSRSLRAAFFRYLKIYISVSEKRGKRKSRKRELVLDMQRTQSCVSKSRLSQWLLLLSLLLHRSYPELINSLQAPSGVSTRPHQRLHLWFVKTT